jgi:hypothetical protein
MTMKTHRDKMATGLLTEGRIMRFRSAQVSAGFRHAGKYLLDLTCHTYIARHKTMDGVIPNRNCMPLT